MPEGKVMVSIEMFEEDRDAVAALAAVSGRGFAETGGALFHSLRHGFTRVFGWPVPIPGRKLIVENHGNRPARPYDKDTMRGVR